MLKIGDRVQLSSNPFDEQIPEEEMMFIFLASQTMTVVDTMIPDEEGTSGQWVKTDMIPDWTDKAYFKKVEE